MEQFNSLSQEQQNLILSHLDLVIEANERVNLTRIEDRNTALVLHVEDSLSGLQEMKEAPDGLYGDLGSGAGYPGLPLAIATGRPTVLIDSRLKKMVILDDVIKKLKLESQVRTFKGRAELLAKKEPGEYSVLTARALSQLPVLMELASPLLKKHGILICYKSHVDDEELFHARKVEKLTGMKLIRDRQFTLEEDFTRRIITFEKVALPKTKLPRREGEAQRNPLSF